MIGTTAVLDEGGEEGSVDLSSRRLPHPSARSYLPRRRFRPLPSWPTCKKRPLGQVSWSPVETVVERCQPYAGHSCGSD